MTWREEYTPCLHLEPCLHLQPHMHLFRRALDCCSSGSARYVSGRMLLYGSAGHLPPIPRMPGMFHANHLTAATSRRLKCRYSMP